MNSRMKILILLLLTAVLCLSVAVASRAMTDSELPVQNSDPAGKPQDQTVQLFSENGLWGAKTPGGRVLIQPQWQHLHAMNDEVLIASKQTADGSRCGLIRTNGELLVPMIYDHIERRAADLWVADFRENGAVRYHIYHDSGTRWTDIAWERCEAEGNTLLLGRGSDYVKNRLENGRLIRTEWHSEHWAGPRRLTMDLNAGQLAAAPDPETLTHLGEAAAAYLAYLFIPGSTLDPGLLSGDDTASILAASRYRNCELRSARVARLQIAESSGFPTYEMTVSVSYRRSGEEDEYEIVETGLRLTLSRNAAGAFTYSSFSDPKLEADEKQRETGQDEHTETTSRKDDAT